MKRHLFSIILLLGSLRCYSAHWTSMTKEKAISLYCILFALFIFLNIYAIYKAIKNKDFSISRLIKKYRIKLCLLAISISVCLAAFYYEYDTPVSRLAVLFSVLYTISFIAWYTCKLLKRTKLDDKLEELEKHNDKFKYF